MNTEAPVALSRFEDVRLLLGQGRYADDLHVDRMTHGCFVRSTIAHARILRIDVAPALSAGALLVLTAADLPFENRDWITRYWHPSIKGGLIGLMARDRVRYVGEPVAFVVANDRYLAEDLAALVEVGYEHLPVVADCLGAQAADAPVLHDSWPRNIAAQFRQQSGEPQRALATAPRRLRRHFVFSRQAPVPLEPRGVVAVPDAARQGLTVKMSTQAHYNVRQNLATFLDLPEYCVRVEAEDVGGGFGAKSRPYPEEIIVAYASLRLARPVKWIEDRLESLVATTQSRAIETHLDVGFDDTGLIRALHADVTVDIGAYVHTSGVVTAEIAGAFACGVYTVPNLGFEVKCVGTNKTPLATYRGAGQPEATYPLECMMDLIAREVGIDAATVRRRNMVAPSDMPYKIGTRVGPTELVLESGDFPQMIDRTLAASGYSEEVVSAPTGARLAWGLACGMESSGFVNYESAQLLVDLRGNVTLLSGLSTQGQGQPTSFGQLAAETLGVAADRVSVRMGDTQLLPFGRGAFATRGVVMGGNAVFGAAKLLLEKVLGVAATLLQADAADLSMREGLILKDGKETSLTLGEIARAVAPGGVAFNGTPSLSADYVFGAEQLMTFGLSVHAIRVAVDRHTGFYRVVDYFVLHDAGRVLNRMIVDGQILGGVVDGLGGAMLSELLYDADGQLLNASLADYLLATATDVPRIRLDHMTTLPGTNPLQVRGVGEGGIIAVSAALTNAVARAIDQKGTSHQEQLFRVPLHPERVLAAAERADSLRVHA